MQITLFSLALVAVLSAAPQINAQSHFQCICETNGVLNSAVSFECCDRFSAGSGAPVSSLPCPVETASADNFLSCCATFNEGGSC
ncbi:hypothetical protein FB451DRAFT_1277211 [Mycena latifolia]|nr:hypothetical protein FB451DRAFT_1277211 [Mycena latifolia]